MRISSAFGRTLALLGLLVLGCCPGTRAQEPAVALGQRWSITSRLLHEERPYWVQLPASYEQDAFYQNKRYPVLVLLDGQSYFLLVSGLVRTMSAEGNEQIPELIVVALPNTDRTRDMTPVKGDPAGGSTAFRRFLQEELLPDLDQRYRTLPYRILAGHSLAGLFTVESLLKQSVFNAYLAVDPSLWWDNQALLHATLPAANPKRALPTALFLAQANNPFQPGVATDAKGQAIQRLVAGLHSRPPAGLRYQHVFFEKEDHFSVPLLGFYQGLAYLFEGYKYPLSSLQSTTSQQVRQHYQRLAQQLGVDLLPPGKLLNQVGLFVLRTEKQVDKALDILQLNQEYYPSSALVYQSLAEAYRQKGNKPAAIAAYQRALTLDQTNAAAKKGLLELRE